ncbi:uncharacterized protein K02A2.6-like [Photinus pyralis]|uniref:uncharacterized protein K02A2.6-like n=1 Tax=Photinus pyralis TaxID=7054 RepID=UPI0012676161|nr:uncharacterized protein K02A2.6-like [Photinus pyralis]
MTLTQSKSKVNRDSVRVKRIESETDELRFIEPQFNVNRVININKTELSEDSQKFMVPIKVGSVTINFEVDTGSPVTLINQHDFNKLQYPSPLKTTNVLFRVYTEQTFAPLGVIQVPIEYGNTKSVEELYVVPAPYAAIVGRVWLRRLGIVDIKNAPTNKISHLATSNSETLKNEIMQSFYDVFEQKVGCVPNFACSLRVKDNHMAPLFMKSRQIPYALQEKVEAELDLMEQNGLIEKTDYSEWGSPLVCVPKPDGNVRLCIDYKMTINPHLQNARYPIPLIDDVLNSLRGSAIFCILDIHKAYQHLLVDKESQKLQTISTHRGTYKMKRLAFGIKTAPNEFQKFIDTALQGLEGVVSYFDDIVVHANSLQECYNRLVKCLNRLRSLNLHLNPSKCTLFAKKIKYLGHIVSAEGIQKTPEKVEAILNAPRLKNVQELRSLIGCVSYYSKFMPKIAGIMRPLYQLLRIGTTFKWTAPCESAFLKIKQEISSNRVLIKYDPKLPLILATDASPVGLSAVLSHIYEGEERPIAFASRALTKSEENYSQLDKEATAIYWGFQKFYTYIYGRKFTLVTDNKPLSHIFGASNCLPTITASRLIRYSMFLSSFDYTIKHRKSEDHANADYLSRAPLPNPKPESTDEDSEVFNIIVSHLISDPITFRTIQLETDNDPGLKELKRNLSHNKTATTEFSLHDNVIFRGPRVMIPNSLQRYVLNELHSTHQGIVKMKALARRYCYWKKIDHDIECLVKSCKACCDVKPNPPKVPLHKWEPPKENWQRIHMDFAGPFQGNYFFIVVDAYSKWPEIIPSKSAPTSASTVMMLQEIFSRNGLPQILVSDNATIFKSREFKDFCNRNGIQQRFIAPGHPATNGQAERFVQILKTKLKAMNEDQGTLHQKLYEILLRYRATPLLSSDKTPAEIFLNRNLCTRLDLLKMRYPTKNLINDSIVTAKLRLGERVQSRNYSSSTLWKYGTVVQILGNLHYLIELDDGYVIKRHIDQLRKTQVPRNEHVPNVSEPSVSQDKTVHMQPNTQQEKTRNPFLYYHYHYQNPLILSYRQTNNNTRH